MHKIINVSLLLSGQNIKAALLEKETTFYSPNKAAFCPLNNLFYPLIMVNFAFSIFNFQLIS